MVVNSALADRQSFSDLLVGQPLGYQLDDLDFTAGEGNSH